MTGYELTARWFAYCDEHPEWVEPTVTALFFAILHRCNELRWKTKFHLPTADTMQRIGIRSPKTYYPALDKLEKAGFIRLLERSRNQYTACIIEVLYEESTAVKNTEALNDADVKIAEALTEASTSGEVAAVKNAEAPTEASASAAVKIAVARETYINNKTKREKTKNIYTGGASPEEPDALDEPGRNLALNTNPSDEERQTPPQPPRAPIAGPSAGTSAPSPTPSDPMKPDPDAPAVIDTRVRHNGNGQMIKPDLPTLTAFMLQKGGTSAMAETMFDFYSSKGWLVGKSPMKDWNSSARKWIRENPPNAPPGNRSGPGFNTNPPKPSTTAPRPTHQTKIR